MQPLTLLYVGGGILLIVLSIPMIRGRVPPNPLYGFRVPATLQNPTVWYAVNRYAGWRLGVTGMLSVFGALAFARIPGITLDNYAWACLAVVALGLGVTLAQSFVYLRRLRL